MRHRATHRYALANLHQPPDARNRKVPRTAPVAGRTLGVMQILRTVQAHHQAEVVLGDELRRLVVHQRRVRRRHESRLDALCGRQFLTIGDGPLQDILVQERFAAEKRNRDILPATPREEPVNRPLRSLPRHQSVVRQLVAAGAAVAVATREIAAFRERQLQMAPRILFVAAGERLLELFVIRLESCFRRFEKPTVLQRLRLADDCLGVRSLREKRLCRLFFGHRLPQGQELIGLRRDGQALPEAKMIDERTSLVDEKVIRHHSFASFPSTRMRRTLPSGAYQTSSNSGKVPSRRSDAPRRSR